MADMEHSITLTESAISQLLIITKNHNADDVRYFLDGGGCSGLLGKWAVGTGKEDGDFTFALGESKELLVDGLTASYMKNATIDYTGDFMPAFKVTIPDTNSCGCGESFQMPDN
jgi:iron-sulfur cluster assembly accessory protein